MTHTIQALAWTLIHFCWQAAAVAVLYRLISISLARKTSQSRYALALSALLLMLACACATFAWELRSAAASSVFATTGSATQTIIPTGEFPRTMMPGFAAAQAQVYSPSLANMLLWIDSLWIMGVVVLSLRSIGGWWLITRLRASASVQAPAAVRASFQRLSAAMGLRRPVLLRISSAISGPMTLGAIRAFVLLPVTAATSLSPEELEVVLAHELAHIRRADFL